MFNICADGKYLSVAGYGRRSWGAPLCIVDPSVWLGSGLRDLGIRTGKLRSATPEPVLSKSAKSFPGIRKARDAGEEIFHYVLYFGTQLQLNCPRDARKNSGTSTPLVSFLFHTGTSELSKCAKFLNYAFPRSSVNPMHVFSLYFNINLGE